MKYKKILIYSIIAIAPFITTQARVIKSHNNMVKRFEEKSSSKKNTRKIVYKQEKYIKTKKSNYRREKETNLYEYDNSNNFNKMLRNLKYERGPPVLENIF